MHILFVNIFYAVIYKFEFLYNYSIFLFPLPPISVTQINKVWQILLHIQLIKLEFRFVAHFGAHVLKQFIKKSR